MSTTSTTQMDKADATALTRRIRTAVDGLWDMLLQAYDRKAWKALGHKTWEAYVKAELGIGRSRSYQLLDQGRVIEAVRRSTGDLSTKVDISERDARDIKPDLSALTKEVKARVEAGEDPKKAAADAIAARRAEKEKAKAEKERAKAEKDAQQTAYDRQRDECRDKLPEAVKQQQASREAALEARKGKAADPDERLCDADRIAELEEAVRVLEDENAALKAENKLYGEMKIQWAAGGYEAVIAGKDEEIRALETRLYRESADKASWAGKAKYWNEQAKKLEQSPNG